MRKSRRLFGLLIFLLAITTNGLHTQTLESIVSSPTILNGSHSAKTDASKCKPSLGALSLSVYVTEVSPPWEKGRGMDAVDDA